MTRILGLALNLLILFSLNEISAAVPNSQLYQIKSGQTLDSILSDLGFPPSSRGQIFSHPQFPKSHVLIPGTSYKVRRDGAATELVLFDFAKGQQWVLRNRDGQGHLLAQPGLWDIHERRVRGQIVGSLFNSLRSQVDSKKLAFRFQEVFLGAVDFARLPKGVPFEMVYEELHMGKEHIGFGRMLYAKVQVGEEVLERYLVRSSHGHFYVDPQDDQSDRPFYAPVGEVKISSAFQKRRFHPVRKRWIAHLGQDYELEPRSPVRAAQRGVVKKVSYDRASGRHVVLRHSNGWESYYLHLKEFAEGLKEGDKVAAGALLGSVGCSGYCTRPHLHFALRQHGTFKDPAPLTKGYSAPQAVLARNHRVMISRGRLAAWREGESLNPQNRN